VLGSALVRGPQDAPPSETEASGPSFWDRWPTWALAGGIVAVLAIPLGIALAVLHDPHWYPLLDVAMTELRIRDVTTSHPPLVGLPGRIQGLGVAGSHPGPVSFWSLAPLYRLYGSSAWAMQAATATLNLLAMAATLWVAHRRGGRWGLLAAAVAVAVLVRNYEAERLTEAWNPYLPMMWWFLFLLAVWSVLCDDLVMLPVATFAGSFCAQTHVPYVGLVAGLGALTVAATAAWFWPRRTDAEARRRLVRWGGAAAAVAVVVWLPPLVDQVRHDPGNMSVLVESFRHPVDPPNSVGDGVEAWLARLDLRTLVTRDQRVHGSPVPGLLLLAAWAASAVVALRRPEAGRSLRRLHVVAAVALGLGLVSIVRIPGSLWDYLVLWASGTTVLVVGAVAWTVIALTGRAGRHPARLATGLAAALAGVLLLTTASAGYDAASAQVPQPGISRIDRNVIPPTIEALEAGNAPGGGRDGHYLVTWDDALTPGLNGYAFLLELERQGFDVGMDDAWRIGARPHRIMSRDEATAVVTYVAGPQVEDWRRRPDAVLVAEFEPPEADQAEYARLRREAIAAMRRAGLDDLVPALDQNLLGTEAYVGMPADAVDAIRRMLDLGAPAAVFVTANPPTPAN
jgi:hypothetical protein